MFYWNWNIDFLFCISMNIFNILIVWYSWSVNLLGYCKLKIKVKVCIDFNGFL